MRHSPHTQRAHLPAAPRPATRRPRRLAVAAAVATLTASIVLPLTGLTATSAAAFTPESYPVQADGTIQLEGTGFGHGVGMSQWGAKGGADAGQNAHQILGAYYPGAALTPAPTRPVRVLLSRWDNANACTSTLPSTTCLEVVAESGQTITNLASGAQIPVPASVGGTSVTALAVSANPAGLTLWANAGGWQQVGGTYSGPLDIASADGVQTTRMGSTTRDYRGTIRIVRASNTTIHRINVLGLEDYLRGVVPAEMPASWPAAAVQAQAVAARTYAAASMNSAGSRAWDLCDTTSCQVYGGVGTENASATTKINSASPSDVRGRVLSTSTGVITAFFSASNGGHSVSGGSAWLPARADGWDPASRWTRTVSGSCLAARYPGRGAFTGLVVTGRDGRGTYGGRVTGLQLQFTSGTVTLGNARTPMATDSAIRGAFVGCGDTGGLRSSMFGRVGGATPVSAPANPPAPAPPSSPAPPPAPPAGALTAGARLGAGAWFGSANGQHRVIVDATNAPRGLLWSSRTCRAVPMVGSPGGSLLTMQSDGNLVLYAGPAIWHTSTHGNPGAYAVLTDDGVLQVRTADGRVLYSSNTACSTGLAFDRAQHYGLTGSPNPLWLLPGDRMASQDGRAILAMQTDGNLVYYRDGRPRWHANTVGRTGARAVLQGDGNFVVYTAGGIPLWGSMTMSPTARAGQVTETRLQVGTDRLSLSRTVKEEATGRVISSQTPWTMS